MVPTTDYGRTLFALWFSKVFLPFRSSSVVRVLGAERRTSTCAASRGPRPSGRVVPWGGSPPHMPGVAPGARRPALDRIKVQRVTCFSEGSCFNHRF